MGKQAKNKAITINVEGRKLDSHKLATNICN